MFTVEERAGKEGEGDTKRERWMNGRPTGGQRKESVALKAQWGSMLGRGKRRGGGGKAGKRQQVLGVCVGAGRMGREGEWSIP